MLGNTYFWCLLAQCSFSATSLPSAASTYLLSSGEALGEFQGWWPYLHPSLPICSQRLCGWHREWWFRGRVPEGAGGQQASLFSEKTTSLLWPILALSREIIQPLHTHTWEDRMALHQIQFLLEWIVVEKHTLFCHSIIWWYILDDFSLF